MTGTTLRTYLRELIEDFPRYAVLARRQWGWTGFRIACKAYLSRSAGHAMMSPIGRIGTHSELVNFLDNFCANELRCQEVEAFLEGRESALVVDIGVNVGVSVRWWLSRWPTVRVLGIDMVAEALEFTSRRVAELGCSDRWNVIQSAVGNHVGVTGFDASNPLTGTTSLLYQGGSILRNVPIETLDRLLAKQAQVTIDLLKIDIEGYAGFALQGANETLQRTRYVCVECHGEEETELSSRLLTKGGFVLFKLAGRHMWWRRC